MAWEKGLEAIGEPMDPMAPMGFMPVPEHADSAATAQRTGARARRRVVMVFSLEDGIVEERAPGAGLLWRGDEDPLVGARPDPGYAGNGPADSMPSRR
jgi:hypothetical protein